MPPALVRLLASVMTTRPQARLLVVSRDVAAVRDVCLAEDFVCFKAEPRQSDIRDYIDMAIRHAKTTDFVEIDSGTIELLIDSLSPVLK